MRSALSLWLFAAVALFALAIAIAKNQRTAELQRVALGRAQTEKLKLAALLAENSRLESARPTEAERNRLLGMHAEAESLRAHLAELRDKAPEGNNGESRAILAKDWVYAGRMTPKATIESVLWAASHGDTDRLAELLGFAPELRPKAEDMFSKLPATAQQEYGTPERVIATLVAGSFPKDPQASQVLVDRQYGEQDAAIVMSVTHSDGESRMNQFRLHNAADGWNLLVPANVMLDFEKTLLGDQQPPPETGSP
jgi:hypothetical protein